MKTMKGMRGTLGMKGGVGKSKVISKSPAPPGVAKGGVASVAQGPRTPMSSKSVVASPMVRPPKAK